MKVIMAYRHDTADDLESHPDISAIANFLKIYNSIHKLIIVAPQVLSTELRPSQVVDNTEHSFTSLTALDRHCL